MFFDEDDYVSNVPASAWCDREAELEKRIRELEAEVARLRILLREGADIAHEYVCLCKAECYQEDIEWAEKWLLEARKALEDKQ